MIITVIGASGGVGQATCLLLKTNLPAGCELRMVDRNPAGAGVALDLSHIPTSVHVRSFLIEDIGAALDAANIVVIAAGMPRKPGMTRDDLFTANATIIRDLCFEIAEHCPETCVSIITNPLNSMLPVAAKALQAKEVYDEKRLFGITTLDSVRARSLIAADLDCAPEEVEVDVIGGHSGPTILPLLSQVQEGRLSEEQQTALHKTIKSAGTAVVEAKAGTGSATLAMGYAAMEFVCALVQGLSGNQTRICAYVPTTEEGVSFFAKPVLLGVTGKEAELSYGELSEGEQGMLQEVLPILQQEIEKGEEFE